MSHNDPRSPHHPCPTDDLGAMNDDELEAVVGGGPPTTVVPGITEFEPALPSAPEIPGVDS